MYKKDKSMNISHTISAALIAACSSTVLAGEVVDLSPSQITNTMSGITNTLMPELIGSEFYDFYQDFSITEEVPGRGDSAGLLYEGTLMTRIVRSNETGNLHFNYRFLDANSALSGVLSHIEITGFADLQTRVEFRNEATSPGVEGPSMAHRSSDGDILTYDFQNALATSDDSRFFFAMVDTDTFFTAEQDINGEAIATIYLESGEFVTLNVAGAVPTPGSLALLSAGGLLATRRRR
jgi:hypothetical protein